MNTQRELSAGELRALCVCAMVVFSLAAIGLTVIGVLLFSIGAGHAYIKGAANLTVAAFFALLANNAYRRFNNARRK